MHKQISFIFSSCGNIKLYDKNYFRFSNYNQSTFKYLEHFSSLKVSLSLALENWPNLDFKIAVLIIVKCYQDNYNILRKRIE